MEPSLAWCTAKQGFLYKLMTFNFGIGVKEVDFSILSWELGSTFRLMGFKQFYELCEITGPVV